MAESDQDCCWAAPAPALPRVTLGFDGAKDNQFVYAINTTVADIYKRVVEHEERAVEGLLRRAFEAGYESASETAQGEWGYGGYCEDFDPDKFANWLYDLKKEIGGT